MIKNGRNDERDNIHYYRDGFGSLGTLAEMPCVRMRGWYSPTDVTAGRDVIENDVKGFSPILLTAVSLACGACRSTMMQVSTHHYPAVPVSSVQMLYQEPTKPYEVIALVSHMNSLGLPISWEIAAVREEAAKLGADAVLIIDAKQHIPFVTGENVTATGNAIKWTD